MRSKKISVLDIGDSKITCLVGEVTRGNFEIIGHGITPAIGFQKGDVIDLEAASRSVIAAILTAENMADFRINSVYTGIAGSQVSYYRKSVAIPLNGNTYQITKSDVERVIKAVGQVGVPSNRKIIHPLPVDYIVGDRSGISNPIGMSGNRLGVIANLITVMSDTLQNYNRILEKAGLNVESCIPVYQMLAESFAVLGDEEKKKGVLLLDIGAEVTQLSFFYNEWLMDADYIMVGAESISRDLASVYRITYPEAEKIKKENGYAFSGAISEEIPVRLSNSTVSNLEISRVIEARLRDIIDWVKEKLDTYRTESKMPESVIISGGGSQIRGIVALMGRELELPVRLAVSSGLKGPAGLLENPGFHSALGLLFFGKIDRKKSGGSGIASLFTRIKKAIDRGFL
ncbi:MAG: cell division protein FtsA [Candidatus Eremiobacteraeota bacterium]|nr:cell division protein FtsA [Candidatus Eremiobacteraeota bacterium]